MEELPGLVRLKKVSFKSQHQSPSYSNLYQNGKLENMSWTRGQEHSKIKEQPCFSSYDQSFELKSPVHAMEFLCRSWSPFASDFLQTFSPENLLLPPHDNSSSEENEIIEVEGPKWDKAQSHIETVNRVDNIWTWLTIRGHFLSDLPMHAPLFNNKSHKMSLKFLNKWLKGQSLKSILRWRKEEKKEKVRLCRARVHAALSVARLAAAVAGFAANNRPEEGQDHINQMMISQGALELDKKMSVIVAAAAALVATVCAEAAESAGAHRTQVASVVDSGLAAQTPTDMISLTASAATCLRGAEILKSRAMADAYFPKNQQLLKVGAQLSVLMPSGHRENKLVSIFPRHKQLILSFGKKYMGGLVTTWREYKIMNVMEESKGAATRGGDYLLCLKTNNGDVKLLFEDEKQSIVWITTISNLFQMHQVSN